MKTYFRDFKRPERKIPDNSRARAIIFAEARGNLGHNVISVLLEEDKGYRIYFSPVLINIKTAQEVPVEMPKR